MGGIILGRYLPSSPFPFYLLAVILLGVSFSLFLKGKTPLVNLFLFSLALLIGYLYFSLTYFPHSLYRSIDNTRQSDLPCERKIWAKNATSAGRFPKSPAQNHLLANQLFVTPKCALERRWQHIALESANKPAYSILDTSFQICVANGG